MGAFQGGGCLESFPVTGPDLVFIDVCANWHLRDIAVAFEFEVEVPEVTVDVDAHRGPPAQVGCQGSPGLDEQRGQLHVTGADAVLPPSLADVAGGVDPRGEFQSVVGDQGDDVVLAEQLHTRQRADLSAHL